jgi:cell division protein FtsW
LKADRTLFTLVAILISIGIIASYSLTTYTTILFNVNEFHFAIREIFFGFVSLIIMYILSQLDPNIWLKRIGFSLLIFSFIMMVAMPFLPKSLVHAVGGAKRWINLGGLSLAPVEFFKIGFVYFLAWSFPRKIVNKVNKSLKDELKLILPYGVFFVIVMYIIAVLQKDLGQVVVLGMTFLFMLLFAGSSFKLFSALLSATFVAFIFFIVTAEHRILRIKSWWAVAQNSILEFFPDFIASKLRIPTEIEPYQIGHSLNAIHNGGIFGVGIGNGVFKLGFLSEVHTDFVLAGVAEEFGFIGVFIIVFIFLFILQRIFKIANRAQDKSMYLFSLGIGLILSFAFLINAYGISGITPIKGISVPFLSYGGSAILAASFGVGMVLMVSNSVNLDKTNK